MTLGKTLSYWIHCNQRESKTLSLDIIIEHNDIMSGHNHGFFGVSIS
jgi:hypothetical protein